MPQPATIETQFELFCQALPQNFQEMAREFAAFARSRKVKSPLQLLQLVLLYCGLDHSLRSCAGKIAQMQQYISDTAVKNRLIACTAWVKAMLSCVFGLQDIVNTGKLRFVVIDGSTVQEPGATETTYRLHIAVDLINLSIRQVEVSTAKVGESLKHYTLEPGDVVLIDRGYNEPKSLAPAIKAGVHVVLRYNPHSMNVFERNEQQEYRKVDWSGRLEGLNNQPGAFLVYLQHDKDVVPGVVHAIPLPAEKAAEARRKAKQRAKKKGRDASQKTLFISGWVLILSTVPLDQLSTETAGKLYRIRWQVELVIKRLKSILNIDTLRARKASELAELYLHGKLLYAAVLEKMAQQRFGGAIQQMDQDREITPWRLWVAVHHEMQAAIVACFPANLAFMADCIKSLSERPRKRKLQRLTPEMLEIRLNCSFQLCNQLLA